MHILFLGGTGFIGPYMLRQAILRGHKVTTFTRGGAATDHFPEVEHLVGDRAGNLEALRGKTWDVVIDNTGYLPEHVEASAELLRENIGHYLFTSTIDAYRDFHVRDLNEDYPLATLPAGAPSDLSRHYGPLKALCEQVVTRTYPDSHTIIRPGWIVGFGDGHRLEYWLFRVKRGEEMLAPGTPRDPVQFIFVRDLAEWVIKMAEARVGGMFNAVGQSMTWGQLFQSIESVTSARANLTWVSADFLKANKVTPYFDLPMWWPPRNDYQIASMPFGLDGGIGAFAINERRARNAGLAHRPTVDILKDTLDLYVSKYNDWQDGKHGGLNATRERELLAHWKSRIGIS